MLASDKTDFKRKTITRDKKGHLCIMIKASMQQEDKTIVNRYIHLRQVHKYIKKVLTNIKGSDGNAIVVGDLNTSLTSMEEKIRGKINKETLVLTRDRWT